MTNIQDNIAKEGLAKIAEALDVLAKNACLYISPRCCAPMRRVAAVGTAAVGLKRAWRIEYEGGKVGFASPRSIWRIVVCIYEPKDLAKVAEALDVLAKDAYLYGGPRRRPRRIVSVSAEKTLRIKYEDGATQYSAPQLKRYFAVYIAKPKGA